MKKALTSIIALLSILSFNANAAESFDFHDFFKIELKTKIINKGLSSDYTLFIYRSDIDGECYSKIYAAYRGSFSLVKCSSFGLESPESYLKNKSN